MTREHFCHSEPAGRRVRNLDLVPYEPGSCTTEDTEDHREMQASTVNGERSTVNGRTNPKARAKSNNKLRGQNLYCHSEDKVPLLLRGRSDEESGLSKARPGSLIRKKRGFGMTRQGRDPSSARSADSG